MRNLKRQNKQSNNITHCILKQASLRHFSAVIFCVPEIMIISKHVPHRKSLTIQSRISLSSQKLLYYIIISLTSERNNSLLRNSLTTGAKAIEFIISILKSLVIPVIWLVLTSVIYSRITPFCHKSHLF